MSLSLYEASQEGNVEAVQRLLAEDGVNVNQAQKEGATPLYIASQQGHTKVVELILAHDGVEVNQATKEGATPLYVASEKGHTKVVELLLAHDGVEVNQAMEDGVTPLYIASHNGHTEVVELLLAHDGVEVNQTNKENQSPLTAACEKTHTNIMALLVFHGAVPKESDLPVLRQRLGPFVPAIQNHMGHTTFVEMLENAGDVHEADWTGLNHASVVARLVFHGAVPKESDLPVLRQRLGTFLKTMEMEYVAMVVFKTCLLRVPVGHALRGMSIYGDHPIRCIESFLLPCGRDTCFPLAQARRTILHLWVGANTESGT